MSDTPRTDAMDNLRYQSDKLFELARTLERELEEYHQLTQKQSAILSAAAIALRGPEPELTKWSHHDVAERAANVVAELAAVTKERDEANEKLRGMVSPAVQGVLSRMAAPPQEQVMDSMRKNLEILDRVKSERDRLRELLETLQTETKQWREEANRLRAAGHALRHMMLNGQACSFNEAMAAWDALGKEQA